MNINPNALASALPVGVSYVVRLPNGGEHVWGALLIAEFQADHLAESGYELVYHPEGGEPV